MGARARRKLVGKKDSVCEITCGGMTKEILCVRNYDRKNCSVCERKKKDCVCGSTAKKRYPLCEGKNTLLVL